MVHARVLPHGTPLLPALTRDNPVVHLPPLLAIFFLPVVPAPVHDRFPDAIHCCPLKGTTSVSTHAVVGLDRAVPLVHQVLGLVRGPAVRAPARRPRALAAPRARAEQGEGKGPGARRAQTPLGRLVERARGECRVPAADSSLVRGAFIYLSIPQHRILNTLFQVSGARTVQKRRELLQ